MSFEKRLMARYIALSGVVLLSGMMLLHTSQEVQRKEARLESLENALHREEQNIRVLEAEWAHLNSPYRLEQLAQRYLDMVPPESKHIIPDTDLLPEEQIVVGHDLPEITQGEHGVGEGAQGQIMGLPVSAGAYVVPARKPKARPVRHDQNFNVVKPAPAPSVPGPYDGMNDLLRRLEAEE